MLEIAFETGFVEQCLDATMKRAPVGFLSGLEIRGFQRSNTAQIGMVTAYDISKRGFYIRVCHLYIVQAGVKIEDSGD